MKIYGVTGVSEGNCHLLDTIIKFNENHNEY